MCTRSVLLMVAALGLSGTAAAVGLNAAPDGFIRVSEQALRTGIDGRMEVCIGDQLADTAFQNRVTGDGFFFSTGNVDVERGTTGNIPSTGGVLTLFASDCTRWIGIPTLLRDAVSPDARYLGLDVLQTTVANRPNVVIYYDIDDSGS